MRLGQAKEQLADDDDLDLDQIRLLIDQAHKGAKEAIVELRDLARGIHPPVLDTGLESALATLTAPAAIPSELSASIQSRPSPAIEAVAYFCVAERGAGEETDSVAGLLLEGVVLRCGRTWPGSRRANAVGHLGKKDEGWVTTSCCTRSG